MATVKTHDGELSVNANQILTTVFGTFEDQHDEEQVSAIIADLPTDQLNGLYAILSMRMNEIKKQLGKTESALLSRMDGDLTAIYGRNNPTIGVADDQGNELGVIEFSSKTKDTLNTEGDGSAAKTLSANVKEALKRLGLNNYIEVQERLKNAPLAEAKKNGTLPPEIDAMLSITPKTTNGVKFTDLTQKKATK